MTSRDSPNPSFFCVNILENIPDNLVLKTPNLTGISLDFRMIHSGCHLLKDDNNFGYFYGGFCAVSGYYSANEFRIRLLMGAAMLKVPG